MHERLTALEPVRIVELTAYRNEDVSSSLVMKICADGISIAGSIWWLQLWFGLVGAIKLMSARGSSRGRRNILQAVQPKGRKNVQTLGLSEGSRMCAFSV